MNQNNTLKNKIETQQLKNLILKKDMQNHGLSHENKINLWTKLEDNHKTNIFLKS